MKENLLFSQSVILRSRPFFTVQQPAVRRQRSRTLVVTSYCGTHYGSSIPAFRFTRSGGHIRRNLCIREGVCIHTRCVYTPTALTYRSRKNAPSTCVYAPTAACLRPCANVASGVYTHLPRTCVYAPASTRDGRRVFGIRKGSTNAMTVQSRFIHVGPDTENYVD